MVRLIKKKIAHPPTFNCRGPSWFLCFARHGDGAELARAAAALLEAKHPGARSMAAKAAVWLAKRPRDPWWVWGSADADVLELMARLNHDNSWRPEEATKFAVLFRGQEVARGSIGADAEVRVKRAGPLVVHFPGAKGRVAEVRVAGQLAAQPPAKSIGPAQLKRRFFKGPNGWRVKVSFHLSRSGQAVNVGIPLPAGLSLPGAPGSRTGTSVASWMPWQSWMDVGEPRATPWPALFVDKNELRLQWKRPRAGRHTVSIQLVKVAPGTYHAGSAWLRSDHERTRGLTSPVKIHLGR